MVFLYQRSSVCSLVYSNPFCIHFHLVLACNKGLKCHALSYSSCSLASCRLFFHPVLSLQSWADCVLLQSQSSHQCGLHAVPSFQFLVIVSFLYAFRYRDELSLPPSYHQGTALSQVVCLHDIFIDNPSIKLLCIMLNLLYHLFPDWKLSFILASPLTTGSIWGIYLMFLSLISSSGIWTK